MGPIRQIGRRMMNVVIKGQGEWRRDTEMYLKGGGIYWLILLCSMVRL